MDKKTREEKSLDRMTVNEAEKLVGEGKLQARSQRPAPSGKVEERPKQLAETRQSEADLEFIKEIGPPQVRTGVTERR